MDVYKLLLNAASEQLNSASSKVIDGRWFEEQLEDLLREVETSGLAISDSSLALSAIDSLRENKDLLVGLGSQAFKLFVFQLCSGKKDAAVNTYIGAFSNADDLIKLMNSNANGIIQAKMELDLLHKNARKAAMELLTKGLRYLLPFLLGLL